MWWEIIYGEYVILFCSCAFVENMMAALVAWVVWAFTTNKNLRLSYFREWKKKKELKQANGYTAIDTWCEKNDIWVLGLVNFFFFLGMLYKKILDPSNRGL